jgi:hypothetical protein
MDWWIFLGGKFPAETRRRREKYFNHGWTRMDTDKKGKSLTRMTRMGANYFEDVRHPCFPPRDAAADKRRGAENAEQRWRKTNPRRLAIAIAFMEWEGLVRIRPNV